MAKNILVVRNAYSHDFGGGERYPVNLSCELKVNGYNPLVASRHAQVLELAHKNDVRTLKMPWLHLQNFSGWRTTFFPLYIVWIAFVTVWYIFTVLKNNISTLHLQSRDDFIAGTIAGKLLKKQVIWTDHADLKYIFLNVNTPFKNPVGKLVMRLARKADAVIIVSHNELKTIEKSIGIKHGIQFVVVHNGLTDRAIKPIRSETRSVTTFVSTSRLVYSKGIQELIDASRKLKASGENIKTILLGIGPDSDALKSKAPDNVIFLGYPDNALNIVAGSDIFVHPSYNEGFSISLVEAAMLSKPTIATGVGGNPEIIQDNITGMLIPPKNTDSLYDAMRYALKNREIMAEYGNNLRKKYEKEFQFDDIVRSKIIPLYKGLK